ncbi:N-acetylglucosamine kinase [Paenibacillus frigoriresistens]|uniref:N-acetylglucosamine kinase n=1 Tax=Paenibacillus alginolyticus TaxID=59839 RepID=UPI0015640A3D|nr:BadF/BadG/BcrA/BcrD ATPase family protein [Paenibacillus frigoriresistens]NRF92020.1 N-acetylglucosamine kinase [Paenibacillus frigoriresistens]
METLKIPLLAIDGGGTKCFAVFMDLEGNMLGQGKGGSCNYQGIGRDAAVRELIHGIQEAIVDLGRDSEDFTKYSNIEIECAVFGLAGLDTEYDRQIIMGLVSEVLEYLHIQVQHLVVDNDGFAALLGATAGEPGILVIAGTGSIVFGINGQGETTRSGGWGHRVGDEGSGYWIGKQAVMAILKAYDGRSEATRMGEWIFPHLGMNNEEELFNWIYSSDYSVEKLSELSRLVSLAALEGDYVAETILTAAGHELFLCVRAVIKQLKFEDKPFKMILQGGVLQNEDLVGDTLVQKLIELTPLVQLETAKKEPIYGVMAMGISYLKSTV